jgi:hypothetical protein
VRGHAWGRHLLRLLFGKPTKICERLNEKQRKMIKLRGLGEDSACLEKNLCELSEHQLEADPLLVSGKWGWGRLTLKVASSLGFVRGLVSQSLSSFYFIYVNHPMCRHQ